MPTEADQHQQRKRKGGRPKGRRTVRQTAEVSPSRCPKCDSTRREAYRNPRRIEQAGIYHGTAYTAIVLRNTRCLDCGQCRVDREYLNEPEEKHK